MIAYLLYRLHVAQREPPTVATVTAANQKRQRIFPIVLFAHDIHPRVHASTYSVLALFEQRHCCYCANVNWATFFTAITYACMNERQIHFQLLEQKRWLGAHKSLSTDCSFVMLPLYSLNSVVCIDVFSRFIRWKTSRCGYGFCEGESFEWLLLNYVYLNGDFFFWCRFLWEIGYFASNFSRLSWWWRWWKWNQTDFHFYGDNYCGYFISIFHWKCGISAANEIIAQFKVSVEIFQHFITLYAV